MAITRAQQAKQLLNEIAPKGERLAYINSREAKLLKKMGGAGKDINGTGIKSYYYDAAGVEGATSGGSRDSGGYGGSGDGSSGGSYDYISPAVQRQSIRDNARIAQEDNQREEQKKKAILQKAIEEDAIRRNPYRYTGTQRALQKGISFAPLLSRLTGITPDYLEEQDKIASTIENIQLGNRGSDVPSQFFGVTYDGPNTPDKDGNITFSDNNPEVNKPFTDAMMSNYKSTVGGFPDRDTGKGGGGDSYIPPVYVPPISADTAASTKDDEADPFTAQFTRTGLTDADKERISQIGGRSIFAANGGRIGYDIGGEVMEEQNLQAGAPDLRLEGSQIPQQEEMASAPDIDAELYQLFLDALRKGDVPQGTTFDSYKQLMMQAMSEQQGGQMQGPQMAQQEMMQPEMQQGIMQNNTMEPEREMAAYGGIMGSDGRKRYGFGSFFKKAARAIKKVAKSPIGKAALLYAGGAYLGGTSLFAGPATSAKYTGGNFFSTLGKRMADPGLLKKLYNPAFLQSTASGGVTSANAAEKILQMKNAAPKTNLLSKALGYVKKDPLTAILAASTAAGLYTKKTNEEEQGLDDILGARDSTSIDPAGIRRQIAANKGNIDPNEYAFLQSNYYAADGGRIGYQDAGPVRPEINTGQIEMLIKKGADNDLIKTFVDGALDNDINQIRDQVNNIMRNNKAQGGLMNLGGNEMDLRGGGFVPLGAKEKADDVPARLSKNEFVFTADAVRAAGGGSVDKGAEKMYNTMKRLEGVVA